MSDTDDTDLLLLIPPNLFLVQSSDSEGYELKTDFRRDKNEIERAVVNDLITQVNELESRICAIESSDSSYSFSCNSFRNRSLDSLNFRNSKLYEDSTSGFTQMPVNFELSNKLDNVRHNNSLSIDRATKLRQPVSLPSTPTTDRHKHQTLSARVIENNQIDKQYITSNTLRLTNPDLVSDEINDAKHNTHVNILKNTSNLISIACKENDSECNHVYSTDKGMEDELSRHLNEKLCLNVPNFKDIDKSKTCTTKMSENSEPFAKMNHDNFDEQVEDESGRHLEVSEVEKLLKEMEDTQLEIEKKLKYREMHYSISKSEQCKHTANYKVGDSINSVPDLGYGVRDLFYRKPSTEISASDGSENVINKTSGKDPVIEEPFTQKKISVLEHSSDRDRNEGHNMKYNTPLSSPLRTSYKSDYKSTPITSSLKCDSELPFSKARKKINFSPPDNGSYMKTPPKFYSDIDHSEKRKEDPQNYFSPGLGKSLDDISSVDETRISVEEEKKKIHSPQRLTKSRIKQPRVFRDIDKRYFRNTKSNFRHVGEKALNFGHRSAQSGNLLSLSDLWHNGVTDSSIHIESDPVKLFQKLEEEKYRRKHCEQQIHELQKRILDDQERLAVAVQVDKEKDLAIKKLWSSWQQLASHWNELEEQRHSLSKQLEAQTKAYDSQAEDIRKKVDRWEKELSKALDLASGYKEKCNLIAAEREDFKGEMENRLKSLLRELTDVQHENAKCLEEKNKLIEKLDVAQSEAEKDRQLVSEYQQKLFDVEQKLNQLEAEISVLREQKENLTLKLKDELSRNKSVMEQKLSLQQMIDEYKKQEKILKEEMRAATERLEMSRVELRALYQGQLEAVVKEKLREFQSQLNAAEAALRAELLSRENELAQQAAHQCHNLTESHKLEIAGLEEKYKSQMKMLVKKIEEVENQKIEAELKLKHESNRRTEIAQKLHSVMETQWRQALNIISSSAASGDAKSQMEWLSRGTHEDMSLDLKKLNKSQPNSAGSSNQDTAPFNKSDGTATYRLATATASVDTKGNNSADAQQHHLKKYIQMLLDRTPGNPIPGILDQTSSSVGPDEIYLNNSSNTTNDSVVSDNQTSDKNTKEREKLPNRQRGVDVLLERRQQLQNINRLFKTPWK